MKISYNIKLSLIACTLTFNAMFGAGPVVHIYSAELFFKYCKQTYTRTQQEAFIRGTLFPDIRYIAHLSRTATHKQKVTLTQVCAEKDPFTAGKLFHSYIDDARAQRSWKAGMHRYVCMDNKKNSHLQKVVEDELAYKKICVCRALDALKTYNWNELHNDVKLRHTLLYQSNLHDYLRQSPLTLFKTRTATKRGYLTLSLKEVPKWSIVIENYTKDVKVKLYTEKLLSDLEMLMKNHAKKSSSYPFFSETCNEYSRKKINS